MNTKRINTKLTKVFHRVYNFVIFVLAGDITPPQVTCPANLNSAVQCGTASGQLQFQLPTGIDNSGVTNVQCSAGGIQLTPQGSQLIGNFPVGVTTVTCTATDTCGLSASCQFTATVQSGKCTSFSKNGFRYYISVCEM